MITLEKFNSMLKGLDWSYPFSEQMSRVISGQNQHKALEQLALASSVDHVKLFNYHNTKNNFPVIKVDKELADLSYAKGNPILSDAEYDLLFGIQATGMTKEAIKDSKWKKVKHLFAMRSLDKVPMVDDDGEVTFINLSSILTNTTSGKLFNKVLASLKLDGAALTLYYDKGKFISAITRGDGLIGEDVTKNVVKCKGFQPTIKDKHAKAVIVEAVFLKKDFKKLSKVYDNPRNGVSGALKDTKGKHAKRITLIAHNLKTSDGALDSQLKKFKALKSWGFNVVPHKLCPYFVDVKFFYNEYNDKREKLNFEIDGIVLTYNKVSHQDKLGFAKGETGNPKWAFALKFPPLTKITTLLDINWSPGLTGTITPVALVKTVDLGVKVQNITLSNLDSIKALWGSRGPKKGDLICVSRRGDVIPHVEYVYKKVKGAKLIPPKYCGICNHKTMVSGPFLICSNESCNTRKLGDLQKWVNTIKDHFKVHGIGPERIYEMFQKHLVRTPADFYKLKPSQLIATLDNVKEAAAKNILAFTQHKELPLHVYLGALNIPTIGQGVFTFIIDAGYDTLDKIISLPEKKLAKIDNLSVIRAKKIHNGLQNKITLMEQLLEQGVRPVKPTPKVTGGKLEGKSFCFTGSLANSRSYYEKIVTDNSGSIKGVSKTLSYLVVGENAGSKLNKAKELGVKILDEKSFLELAGVK